MSEPVKLPLGLDQSCPACGRPGLLHFGLLTPFPMHACVRCRRVWASMAFSPASEYELLSEETTPVPTGGPAREALDALRPLFNSPAPNVVVAAEDSEHRSAWYLQCLPWVETTPVPPHGGAPEEGDGA